MTRIDELLASGPTTSFEFFPPKTDAGERNLRDTLHELEPLAPSFVSVTYGAGGSTRERTHRIVVDILEHTTMNPMAHLTAVGHKRDELCDILARYRDAGVANILALRGDPPRGEEGWWELERAIELVHLAREVGGDAFSVGVAAHPEVHPLATDRASDRRFLAEKLCAADFGVTQFFFRVQDYLAMVEDLDALGCRTPVVAGVMPVTAVGQIVRMAEMSGAAFPNDLAERLHKVEDDPAEVRRIGVDVATQLCQELLDAGAPGLHFYTLNRSTATREIHANLNL
ncbi:methylenetetrahydrofolate reductase [Nitriliruptor alkaliphilus]|uniref:methylenetetrahydrofolate reductase n=1 Tax=Nitriliruptor alkaliphilus TaxID=427918 RepID=UPI000A98F7E8|nr:methylenetetrahydrofolate reductase [Nitriliruptor alkaliphilus]